MLKITIPDGTVIEHDAAAVSITKGADPASRPVTEIDCKVLKAVDERRYVLGLAYPAMRADVGKAADGHRDFVAAETLEEAAWSWMAKGRNIGLGHADGTDGAGVVVESYIYRGPDWTVDTADGSTQVIKAGDWLVGTVFPPATWDAIKAGRFNGFSPQGSGRRTVPSPDRLERVRTS